jgi:hypothetical protein
MSDLVFELGIQFKKCPSTLFLANESFSLLKYQHLRLRKMEILAIVVLGASLFFSFSTSERQPELKTNSRPDNDDPDWTFTQPYELDGSKSKG